MLEQLQALRINLPPREALLATFDGLHAWIHQEGFCGCSFINAAAEFQAREHPIHRQAALVKAEVADHFRQLLQAMAVQREQIESYGKGAIVGTRGELEHTAAVLHPRFGAPVRAAIGGGADIIPGTKKVAGPGASITMPIGNKDDRWVFDDMDAAEVAIADAPRERVRGWLKDRVDLVALDAGGAQVASTRPQIGAVLHTHSVNATVLSRRSAMVAASWPTLSGQSALG